MFFVVFCIHLIQLWQTVTHLTLFIRRQYLFAIISSAHIVHYNQGNWSSSTFRICLWFQFQFQRIRVYKILEKEIQRCFGFVQLMCSIIWKPNCLRFQYNLFPTQESSIWINHPIPEIHTRTTALYHFPI